MGLVEEIVAAHDRDRERNRGKEVDLVDSPMSVEYPSKEALVGNAEAVQVCSGVQEHRVGGLILQGQMVDGEGGIDFARKGARGDCSAEGEQERHLAGIGALAKEGKGVRGVVAAGLPGPAFRVAVELVEIHWQLIAQPGPEI